MVNTPKKETVCCEKLNPECDKKTCTTCTSEKGKVIQKADSIPSMLCLFI